MKMKLFLGYWLSILLIASFLFTMGCSSKYSIDGGKIWKPPIKAKAKSDGRFVLILPDVKDRKLLRIKLRDYENTAGFQISR